MSTFLNITLTAALPVIASVVIYILDRKAEWAKKIPYIYKQVLIGIIFGFIAVLGTEFGVKIEGATVNVRDAAPLCAGLIFGAPSGILAGIIGGIERWFAVYWGAGMYTRVACTVATILAGFFGAAIRTYVFDNKKPSIYYGLVSGVVMEILHMLLIFLTNINDIEGAFNIVKICSPWMVTFTGLSVMFTVLFVSVIGKQKTETNHDLKQISQTFQRWLALVVIVAFLFTTVFSYVLQSNLSRSNANSLLSLNLEDVKNEIRDASDKNLLGITEMITERLEAYEDVEEADFIALCNEFNVSEINVVNSKGIITHSTYSKFIGYDMSSGSQSAEFMVLLDGETEFAQEYGPVSFDRTISRKYAGVALEDGGFVQVGYGATTFQRNIASIVKGLTKNRHVGETGHLLIVDSNKNVVSNAEGKTATKLENEWITSAAKNAGSDKAFIFNLNGVNCYCMYTTMEGYFIIGILPQSEAFFLRDVSVYLTVFMEVVIFAVMFLIVYILIKKLIVDNINKINASLAEITGGNLDVTVDVRSNEEFASLSDDINSTVCTLKRYIAEAAARIDQELEYAKSIQLSAMPSIFPPYPDRKEFDIYALMRAAKEVGGDFYDFYMLGEDKLAFMISDVSGKGIPAAMFMMTSKTLLKSLVESGLDVGEAFTVANNELCENNEAGMFVTSWLGVIDLKTGVVSFANAGHMPPVIKRAGGEYEYMEGDTGFVLAGIEGFPYTTGEMKLGEGDIIYLYTDGVTDAINMEEDIFGEERLVELLNKERDKDVENLCKSILAGVDAFVGNADQFDDITMLALRFNFKKCDK